MWKMPLELVVITSYSIHYTKLYDKFTIKESLCHLTYSISDSSADFYAKNIKLEDGLYIFDLVTPIEIYKGLKLGIPALVNVENAVGACRNNFV